MVWVSRLYSRVGLRVMFVRLHRQKNKGQSESTEERIERRAAVMKFFDWVWPCNLDIYVRALNEHLCPMRRHKRLKYMQAPRSSSQRIRPSKSWYQMHELGRPSRQYELVTPTHVTLCQDMNGNAAPRYTHAERSGLNFRT